MIIPLTKGFSAVVDDCDSQLAQYRWCASKCKTKWYAQRRVNGKKVYMHRVILGLTDHPLPHVDHKDEDGLNNRRSNLRIATKAQNAWNSPRARASGVRFVVDPRYRAGGRWKWEIRMDHKHHQGWARSKEEAEAKRAAIFAQRGDFK